MRLSAPGPPIRTLGFMGDGSGLWLQTGNRTHVVPLLGGQTRPFLAPENTGASWTRDGSRLAYFKVSNGDRLFVADRSGANAREIFVRAEPGIHTHNPVWSPDAQWIYFVHGKSVGPSFEMDIWRIRPSGEAPEQLTEVKTGLDYLAPIGDRTVLYVAQAADGTGPWLWALDVPTRQTRRLVSGLDQYRTVTVSNDERRIVTTIANPTTSLSIFPLTDRIAEERDIRPHPQVAVPARMPRFGRTSLFYSSNYGPGEGLWRLKDGRAVEIWKGSDGRLVEPPAVSPDESRLVVTITSNGKPQLSIMSSEGTDVRTLNSTLVPEGMADWSPDGTWIVVGGTHEGAPGLFRLSPDGMLMRIFSGRALNPIWSPDGNLIIFNGPIVTGMSTLQAVRPDGTPASIPSLKVRPGGQRFLRDGRGVVFQGERLDFEVLDLASGRTRSLTHFAGSPLMSARRFDISPDGMQIVFDRSRENADIVLIELPE